MKKLIITTTLILLMCNVFGQSLIRGRINLDVQKIDDNSYVFSDWTIGFEYLLGNAALGADIGIIIDEGDAAVLFEGLLKYYSSGSFTGLGFGGFLGVASTTEYDDYYGYTSTGVYLRLGLEASYGIAIFNSLLLTPDVRLGYGLNSNGGGLYFSPGGALCYTF